MPIKMVTMRLLPSLYSCAPGIAITQPARPNNELNFPHSVVEGQGQTACTVFELVGQDRPGLLADVTQLLTCNGCDVRSAAVSCSIPVILGLLISTGQS